MFFHAPFTCMKKAWKNLPKSVTKVTEKPSTLQSTKADMRSIHIICN